LLPSVSVLVHWLPQDVCPVGHVAAGGKPHEPCWHVYPAAQSASVEHAAGSEV